MNSTTVFIIAFLFAIATMQINAQHVLVGVDDKKPQQTVSQRTSPELKVSNTVLTALTDAGAGRWADSVLSTLDLRERIAQMMTAFSYSDVTSPKLDDLRELIIRDGIGGVIISKGIVADAKALNDSIQRWTRVPVLISADFEHGLSMRLEGATEFPSAMALGATRTPQLAYAMGYAVGNEARSIGVHQNYAPVSDVNNNPSNPVINVRSYGENPDLVSAMAGAYARGLQEARVIATAKHFPGHGDTDVDSHTYLPSIGKQRKELDSMELLPFRNLIRDGVMSVMTAHIAVPSMSGDSAIPATFSRRVLDTVLRRELGFKGLIVSDALNMGAVANSYSSVETAKNALLAGVDVLLIPKKIRESIDSLVVFTERGDISKDQIDDSVLRILRYKYWSAAGMEGKQPAEFNSPAFKTLALSIARKALTLVRNDGTLPLRNEPRMKTDALLLLHGKGNTKALDFMSLLEARINIRNTVIVRRKEKKLDVDSIASKLGGADRVIVVSFAGVRVQGDPAGISDQQQKLLDALAKKKAKHVLIALSSPYVLATMPNAAAMICTYDKSKTSMQAAVDALTGEFLPTGKLPVSIPGIAVYGTGLKYASRSPVTASSPVIAVQEQPFSEVDALIEEKIKEQAFPGAQLCIASSKGVTYYKNYGRLHYESNAEKVNNNTLYDIASLTKVIGTSTAVMKLYEDGKLRLDDPVVQYIPEFGVKGKRDVKIRHLLSHNSGLPAFKLYYKQYTNAPSVLDDIYGLPLLQAPGTKMVYSDLGFITLAKIVEQIVKMPIDRCVDSMFFSPLEMHNTMYAPPLKMWEQCAPTEIDNYWRMRTIRGSVHDENAALLGGIAGHAGLFSTAKDLSKIMRMFLNGGTLNGKRFLKKTTISGFTKQQKNAGGRGLGWDRRSATGSSSGAHFSSSSYGHTGFTGTSIWVDPEADLVVIFLTNRVYPTRKNKALPRFRAPLHNAIRKALKKTTQ
jgi:beta-N-acetylhexosaminidase